MYILVKKWGNSASVRIPIAIMTAVNLRLNDPVNVREENGRIVIEPIPSPVYRLEKLLAGITSKNVHKAIDFGKAIGKESF